MISIVVATSENNVIGRENKLIWHIPDDLKRFRKITTGGVVVMGRKTHLSIGRVLPNRLNVILSNDMDWSGALGDGCVVCHSIEEVLEKFKHEDLFIIGGGEIYKQFLPYTTRIYKTLIKKDYDGDTFFPVLGNDWIITDIEIKTSGDLDFEYQILERID
jgi:dihydrofolate reductase